MLMENAVKHTKDVIILMLRAYFNNSKNYRNKLPRQLASTCFEKAVFYDSEPQQLREFPFAIISNMSGNMVTAGLGDMCSEVLDPRTSTIIAYRYQGFYELTTSIDICCQNPLEREVFTDFIAKAIRFDLRRFIQDNGVLVKDVSYGGETTAEYNSDKIYIAQLKVNSWSNWVEDRQLLDPDEFNIRVTMDTKNSTTTKVVTDGRPEDYHDNGENDK